MKRETTVAAGCRAWSQQRFVQGHVAFRTLMPSVLRHTADVDGCTPPLSTPTSMPGMARSLAGCRMGCPPAMVGVTAYQARLKARARVAALQLPFGNPKFAHRVMYGFAQTLHLFDENMPQRVPHIPSGAATEKLEST